MWGGCSDNVDFGERVSKQYVDAQETGQDSRAAVNLHNNAAGRMVSYVHISCICFINCELRSLAVMNFPYFSIGSESNNEAHLQVPRYV